MTATDLVGAKDVKQGHYPLRKSNGALRRSIRGTLEAARWAV